MNVASSTPIGVSEDGVTAASKAARHSRAKFAVAVTCIRQACEEHGLEADQLVSLLSPQHHRAIRYALGANSSMPSRREMRAFVKELEETLYLSEPLAPDLASPITVGLHLLRSGLAGAVVAISLWLVIGSILTGQDEMARTTSPAVAVVALVIAMVTLGLLEAAHIGAVALSTADVSTLKTSHPRVFHLHTFINTKSKLEEYLAARQFGVVLTVFVISYVTRTGDLRTFPGTSIGFPHILQPLLDISAPGALLVLVFAQVAPQLVTARRPAAMMNLAPMAAAFHCTRAIGKLGMARPARWLVAWSPEGERIASAPRERYNAETVDVLGSGVLVANRTVTVGHRETTAVYQTTTAVHGDGRDQLSGVSSMPASPTQMKLDATIIRAHERLPAIAEVVQETRLHDGGGIRLSLDVAPHLDAFQTEDVVDVHMTASFNSELTEDFVIVDQPTKLVMMRVIVEHPQVPLPPAVLTMTRYGERLPFQAEAIRPQQVTPGGSVEFIAAIPYPDAGNTIRLRWGAEKETPHAS